MAPIDEAETVCLGVAVDHRIRRLLKPVPQTPSTTTLGSHLPILDARGKQLGCRDAEISVTKELAAPARRGGIAVALQQPRDNHPFSEGVDAVIDDCSTLAGLDELFLAASCGTLSIRANVTVIDLMPYIPDKIMNAMTDDQLRQSFDVASRAFCEKMPDVVLCAGKIFPPRPQFPDTRKVETYKLESCGIGRVFGDTPRNPSLVRLRGEGRSLIPIQKVNGFHLSYALNYRSHYSCLRQLQLLSVAEACQTLSGSWEEDAWMRSIRDTCATVVEMTNTSSPRRSGKNDSPAPKPRALYLPDYEKMYSANLRAIRGVIDSFSGGSDLLPGLYDTLLGARLTQTCNDTVLVLREMARLKAKGWKPDFDKWNTDTLRKAEQSTRDFVRRPRFLGEQLRHGRLSRLASDARVPLGLIADDKKGMDLTRAADTFLNLAVGLEKLLLDLLEQESAVRPAAADDGLASALGRMKIAPKEPVVQVTPVRRRQAAEGYRA